MMLEDQQSNGGIFQGRETELSRIFTILGQTRRHNIILLGESGSGRTAILLRLEKLLLEQNQPMVILIDLEKSILKPVVLLATLETQLAKGQGNKQIIILDGLESLLTAETRVRQAVLQWIKRAMVTQEAQLIISCNQSYYQQFIASDERLISHSQTLILTIPNFMTTVAIVRAHLQTIFDHRRVIIPESIIPPIVAFAHRYIHDSVLPGSALHLLDASIAYLKQKKQSLELELKDVVEVISQWTGISREALLISDEEKLRYCAEKLSEQIDGQEEALQKIQRALQAGFLKLHSTQPMAMMLFVGPKSVGKMLTARALAKLFYGSEHYLLQFNMADYREAFDLKRLLGDGTSEGLLKKMHQYPAAVYLFDGIELAHPQVISELSDHFMRGDLGGQDLSQAIMIMTAENELKVKSKSIKTDFARKGQKENHLIQLVINDLPGMQAPKEYQKTDSMEEIQFEEIDITKQFGEQFGQWMKVIPFKHLELSGLEILLEKNLHALQQQLKTEHQIQLTYAPTLARELLFHLSHDQYTVACIRQLLDEKVLPIVSQTLLDHSPGELSAIALFLEFNGNMGCRSHSVKE